MRKDNVARVNPIPAWIEPEVSARLGAAPARPSWPPRLDRGPHARRPRAARAPVGRARSDDRLRRVRRPRRGQRLRRRDGGLASDRRVAVPAPCGGDGAQPLLLGGLQRRRGRDRRRAPAVPQQRRGADRARVAQAPGDEPRGLGRGGRGRGAARPGARVRRRAAGRRAPPRPLLPPRAAPPRRARAAAAGLRGGSGDRARPRPARRRGDRGVRPGAPLGVRLRAGVLGGLLLRQGGRGPVPEAGGGGPRGRGLRHDGARAPPRRDAPGLPVRHG